MSLYTLNQREHNIIVTTRETNILYWEDFFSLETWSKTSYFKCMDLNGISDATISLYRTFLVYLFRFTINFVTRKPICLRKWWKQRRWKHSSCSHINNVICGMSCCKNTTKTQIKNKSNAAVLKNFKNFTKNTLNGVLYLV